MRESQKVPTYAECVAATLRNASEPMTISSIIDAVEALRPVGNSARSAVYRAIGLLYQAVPVETGRYRWLSTLLAGATLRHPLAADEARRGYLMLDELEHAVFCPEFFQSHEPVRHTLNIALFGGPSIDARIHVERRTWSIYMGKPFVEWIQDQGGQAEDDIIVVVRDAGTGSYELRLQPYEVKETEYVRDRDIQVALSAEDIAADDRRARTFMPTWELAAHLIARGLYHNPVPPDDLHYVLEKYSMLHLIDDKGYSVDEPPETLFGRSPAAGVRRYDERPARRSLFDMDDWLDDFHHEAPAGEVWPELAPEDAPMPDDANGLDDLAGQFGENCGAYELYLEQFQESELEGAPLAHHEFHLLEAELEYLVALEVEFGGLLQEQEARKEELSAKLFIDPDAWPNDDFDIPDSPDYEDPPYWEN